MSIKYSWVMNLSIHPSHPSPLPLPNITCVVGQGTIIFKYNVPVCVNLGHNIVNNNTRVAPAYWGVGGDQTGNFYCSWPPWCLSRTIKPSAIGPSTCRHVTWPQH
jgi:hypothetical protein